MLQRGFSGYGFPYRRLSPLEVLRQTSGRAAGQAPVIPFHFRYNQQSPSNRSIVCIGITISHAGLSGYAEERNEILAESSFGLMNR